MKFLERTNEVMERQSRVYEKAITPKPVKMSAEQCKTLCDARGIQYLPGYESRVLQYTITNEAVDRYGDIVKAGGADFKNFRNNPVMCLIHDSQTFPVGNSIREWKDSGTSIKAWGLFLDDRVDKTGTADTTFRFASSGFMKGVSIGFIPKKIHDPDDEERSQKGMSQRGVIFEKWELLEWSPCPIPANPEALTNSFDKSILDRKTVDKAKKLDLFDQKTIEVLEKALEDEPSLMEFTELTKEEVQELDLEDIAETKPGWDETENQFRLRVREPNLFRENTFRTVPIKRTKPKVNSVMGKLKENEGQDDDPMKIQNLMFPKDDGWTLSEAKAWVRDHKDILKITLDEVVAKHWKELEWESCEQFREEARESIEQVQMMTITLSGVPNFATNAGGTTALTMTGTTDWNWSQPNYAYTWPYTDKSLETKELTEELKTVIETLKSLEESMKEQTEVLKQLVSFQRYPALHGDPPEGDDKLYEGVLSEINETSKAFK